MSELASILTAFAGLVSAIIVGVKFAWNKIETRSNALEQRIDAIDVELQKCRDRERTGAERETIQLTVIELLWSEVNRFDPTSSMLARAKRLLDKLQDDNKRVA